MPSRDDRVDAFLTGTLDDADTAAFLAELDRDPALRDELAWGMLIEGLLAEAPVVDLARRRPRPAFLALAVAAALALAASLWLTLGPAADAPPGPRLLLVDGGSTLDDHGPGCRLGPSDSATLVWPSGAELQLAGPGETRWASGGSLDSLHSDGSRLATIDSPTGLSVTTPDGRLLPASEAAWSLQLLPQRQVVQVQRGTVQYTIDLMTTTVAAGEFAIFANRSVQQHDTLLVDPGVWARWDCDHGSTPIACRGPAAPWPLQAIEDAIAAEHRTMTGLVLDGGRRVQSASRRQLAGILGGGTAATGGTIACWIRAGEWPQLPERLLLARIHADDDEARQLNWALNRSILTVLARQPDQDHHVVLHLDRDGALTTYFNGERGTTGRLESGRPLPANCRLSLGPAGADQPAIVLRQIAIWTRPLAQTDIEALYQAGPDGWSLADFGLR